MKRSNRCPHLVRLLSALLFVVTATGAAAQTSGEAQTGLEAPTGADAQTGAEAPTSGQGDTSEDPCSEDLAVSRRPVDLRQWKTVTYDLPVDGQTDAVWVVKGDSVEQERNADPSIFVSDEWVENVVVHGTWLVKAPGDGDDDFIGFVIGYRDPGHFYLFDWKKRSQGIEKQGDLARRGMSFKRVSVDYEGPLADRLPSGNPFRHHELWTTQQPEPAVELVDFQETPGWEFGRPYEFCLDHRPGTLRIVVRDGEKTLYDEVHKDATYPAGRFGFYNYSQSGVTYRGFEIGSRPDPGKGLLAVVPTEGLAAPPRIELILDASGSMREKRLRIDGRLKIDVAKEVLGEIVDDLPDQAYVALRAYGHRVREGRDGDCRDSELLVPFAKLDRPGLHEKLQSIGALGTTPIAYSLRQVPRDFAGEPGRKLVILVTDGKEECGESPVEAASELVASGLELRVDVVGFALAEEQTKADMKEVARLADGSFFDAQDRETLLGALQRSMRPGYEVYDASGATVGSGPLGGSPTDLPEGVYSVHATVHGHEIPIDGVRVVEGRSTRIEIFEEEGAFRHRLVEPPGRASTDESKATRVEDSPGPSSANPLAASITERLEALDHLRDSGVITDEEYESKRRAILSEL
jgi:hypothetical protein